MCKMVGRAEKHNSGEHKKRDAFNDVGRLCFANLLRCSSFPYASCFVLCNGNWYCFPSAYSEKEKSGSPVVHVHTHNRFKKQKGTKQREHLLKRTDRPKSQAICVCVKKAC